MSKISLSSNILGTGTLTIASPNTDSDATINLPTVTGGDFIVSNASGNVGIGTSSPQSFAKQTIQFDGGGTVSQAQALIAYGGSPTLSFRQAAGTAASPSASNTVSINLIGSTTSDGTTFLNTSAIQANVDTTVTAGSHPTHITFATTPSGSTSRAERMRITSAGFVGIGTSSPATTFDVAGSIYASGIIRNTNGGSAASPSIQPGNDGDTGMFWPTTNTIGFSTTGTERARITSGGNLLVGTTSPFSGSTNQFTISSASSILTLVNNTTTNSSPAIRIVKSGATNNTSQIYINFAYNSGANGNGAIAGNGDSQATFITQSDARLKENVTDLPSQLDNVMVLRPVEFDYKATGGHQIGFIAQEVQAVYPDLVSEGDDGYLTLAGFDKNTARLIKAIQELNAKVDAQAAEIAALKGQA